MRDSAYRLLIVDADADIRGVIADLIDGHGFALRDAASIDEAARALREILFDVVLCHLELLRSHDGLLVQRVRELRPSPRIVAMSADGARAARHEADAKHAKPFTRGELVAALRPSAPAR